MTAVYSPELILVGVEQASAAEQNQPFSIVVSGESGLPEGNGRTMVRNSTLFHRDMPHLHATFGADEFGRRAESFARFFGTPTFLIGQTVIVTLWIAVNVIAVSLRWDPYPFILLNLAFSLQAAYAAPLILLAQTRQADRDRAMSESDANHRQALAQASEQRQEIAIRQAAGMQELLEVNTRLTEQVSHLTEEIHQRVVPQSPG